MSGTRVSTGGFLPSLSLPSPKKVAKIGTALLIIASVGATLYFNGLPLLSAKTWTFVAGGGVISAIAYIASRKFFATHHVPSGQLTGRRANHGVADPKTAEKMFSETVINDSRVEYQISDELAFRLVKDFSNNEKWLQAMIEGMTRCSAGVNSRHRTRLSEFIEKMHQTKNVNLEYKLGFTKICTKLCQDFSTPKSKFDALHISSLSMVLNEVALTDEELAARGVQHLREGRKFNSIFMTQTRDESKLLLFPLVKFLTPIEFGDFHTNLSSDHQKEFEDKYFEDLLADSHAKQINLSTHIQTVKLTDLAPSELAVFNCHRQKDIFIPIQAIIQYFEGMPEDQLAIAFGVQVKTEQGIVPWMSEKLVGDLFDSEEGRVKFLAALLKGSHDVARTRDILYNIPWFSEFKKFINSVLSNLDEQLIIEMLVLPKVKGRSEQDVFKRLLIYACGLEGVNSLELFNKMDEETQISSLNILFEKKEVERYDHLKEAYASLVSHLTTDQWIVILTSQFSHDHFGDKVYLDLLNEFCKADKCRELVEKVQDPQIFNSFLKKIRESYDHYGKDSEFDQRSEAIAAELHVQGKLKGTDFAGFGPNPGDG